MAFASGRYFDELVLYIAAAKLSCVHPVGKFIGRSKVNDRGHVTLGTHSVMCALLNLMIGVFSSCRKSNFCP